MWKKERAAEGSNDDDEEVRKEDQTVRKQWKIILTKGKIKTHDQIIVGKPRTEEKSEKTDEEEKMEALVMMIRKEEEPEKHEPSKGRIRKGGVSGSKEQRSKITDLIRNFNAITSTKGEGGEQMARNRNTEDRILKKDRRDQSMKRKAGDVVAAMVLEKGSLGKSKRIKHLLQ